MLFRSGLSGVFSLGGWCRQFQTGFLRPRPTQDPAASSPGAVYAAFTLFGRPFQSGSTTRSGRLLAVLLPRRRRNASGLGSSAFAHHYSRNNCCSPLLRVLRCFSSPRSPRFLRCQASCLTGSPIRTPADLRLFAPPRGFSQLVTSFVASESQGIPRTLLLDFLVSSFLVISYV